MGLLGSIGSIVGDIGGSVITGAWQHKENKLAREWSERMSNTAHRREVADLKAAGLNPILSAGGSGATTPGVQAALIPDLGRSLGSGVASAVSLANAKADIGVKRLESEKRQYDVDLQKGMMDWLKENPQYRDLVYSGMASEKAGVNSSVYAPIMGWNTGKVGAKVKEVVDRLLEPKLEQFQRVKDAQNRKSVESRTREIPSDEIRRKFGQ